MFLQTSFFGDRLKKIFEDLFIFFKERLKNFFEKLVFLFFFRRILAPVSLALASSIPVLGLERVCPQKGCPWP